MVIKIVIEDENNKGSFRSFIYEFDHVSPNVGIVSRKDGRTCIVDRRGDMLCIPDTIMNRPEDGRLMKYVACYKTMDVGEAPFCIAYKGDMFVMENGKTVDKF